MFPEKVSEERVPVDGHISPQSQVYMWIRMHRSHTATGRARDISSDVMHHASCICIMLL